MPRRNVWCVGRNYRAHAAELSGSVFKNNDNDPSRWPIVFTVALRLGGSLLTYGLPNTIQFVSYIGPASWLYTLGITMVFAFLVNSILGAKFKSVNMVEALKSVE